jgi:hypothetical protein
MASCTTARSAKSFIALNAPMPPPESWRLSNSPSLICYGLIELKHDLILSMLRWGPSHSGTSDSRLDHDTANLFATVETQETRTSRLLGGSIKTAIPAASVGSTTNRRFPPSSDTQSVAVWLNPSQAIGRQSSRLDISGTATPSLRNASRSVSIRMSMNFREYRRTPNLLSRFI